MKNSSLLRILPLGGLGEIGMNCMILETQEDIILIDCGLLFTDLEEFGVEFAVPNFNYLIERKDKIRGLIVTHGHEDHIGGISYALKAGLRMPIYGSELTLRMTRHRIAENGLEDRADFRVFKLSDQFKVGGFKIQTVPVNHSILEACALIIDTPLGKVIHTGDFRIDPSPYYGKPLDLDPFKKAASEGVFLLMSDSTNIERNEPSTSEAEVQNALEKVLAASENLTVVSLFSSNIARIGQIFELADRMNKKVALSGRSMEQNVRMAIELGYLKHADKVLVDMDQVQDNKKEDLVVLAGGCQGEYRSALARMSLGEHRFVKLNDGDLVVLSSSFIPGNEKAINRTINNIFKQGAEVVFGAAHEIHASGHATYPELKLMIETVKPKYFIPVHGEYRHLVFHARLAESLGIEKSFVAVNGDVIEFNEKGLEVKEHIEDTRVLIEDTGDEMTRSLLKDRRKLAEKGAVFVLMAKSKKFERIVSGPQVVLCGTVREEMQGFYIEETVKVVKKVIREFEPDSLNEDFRESVRIEVRRFFNENIGKKPTVVPLVLEV